MSSALLTPPATRTTEHTIRDDERNNSSDDPEDEQEDHSNGQDLTAPFDISAEPTSMTVNNPLGQDMALRAALLATVSEENTSQFDLQPVYRRSMTTQPSRGI